MGVMVAINNSVLHVSGFCSTGKSSWPVKLRGRCILYHSKLLYMSFITRFIVSARFLCWLMLAFSMLKPLIYLYFCVSSYFLTKIKT